MVVRNVISSYQDGIYLKEHSSKRNIQLRVPNALNLFISLQNP